MYGKPCWCQRKETWWTQSGQWGHYPLGVHQVFLPLTVRTLSTRCPSSFLPLWPGEPDRGEECSLATLTITILLKTWELLHWFVGHAKWQCDEQEVANNLHKVLKPKIGALLHIFDLLPTKNSKPSKIKITLSAQKWLSNTKLPLESCK